MVCGVTVCPFSGHKGNQRPQMPEKQGSNASVTKVPLQQQDKPALGTAQSNAIYRGRAFSIARAAAAHLRHCAYKQQLLAYDGSECAPLLAHITCAHTHTHTHSTCMHWGPSIIAALPLSSPLPNLHTECSLVTFLEDAGRVRETFVLEILFSLHKESIWQAWRWVLLRNRLQIRVPCWLNRIVRPHAAWTVLCKYLAGPSYRREVSKWLPRFCTCDVHCAPCTSPMRFFAIVGRKPSATSICNV